MGHKTEQMKSFADVYDKFLAECRRKIDAGEFSEVAYDTWIKNLKPLKMQQNTVYLSVPTDFQKSCIIMNYAEFIKEVMSSILGFPVDVDITVEANESPAVPPAQAMQTAAAIPSVQPYSAIPELPAETNPPNSELNYEYSFDTFIVGSSNQFAYAASTAVAKSDFTDKNYNPLFIYGPSGMGKTHLLNAIYIEIQTNHPEKNVMLVTGEQFTNELIDQIGKKDTQSFKQKYRSADVLLIDDIHFIAGKDSTQEEFFHTFNELYNRNKQIVITSDRPPKEIKTLEDRIRTRFEWGIIADISAPEYETRVAIIIRKATAMNFELSDEVVECIANRLKSSIRQLEGCVKKLKAAYDLVGTPPTLVMAQNAIREILQDEQNVPITFDMILSNIAGIYGVKTEDILSQRRSTNISLARKVCAYVMKEVLNESLQEIGNAMGGRDHSTVIYYIRSVEDLIKKEPHTKDMIDDIIKNLHSV